MINVSEWTIFIDDLEGELAMEKREDATGRTIDVLAKEEIMPEIKALEDRLMKAEMAMAKAYAWPNDGDPRTEHVKNSFREYREKYPVAYNY